MLPENELKKMIENQYECNQYILDKFEREKHRQFILGLEAVLNE